MEIEYSLECVYCGYSIITKDPNSVESCPAGTFTGGKCGAGFKVAYKCGKCVCGEWLELNNFTNACVCGRDYNSNGTLLAPREQWGEETGETATDILTGNKSEDDLF